MRAAEEARAFETRTFAGRDGSTRWSHPTFRRSTTLGFIVPPDAEAIEATTPEELSAILAARMPVLGSC